MRLLYSAAVLLCLAGCGGSQGVTGGPQAGGDHFLRGLYGGSWQAGTHKGTTLFGIAKDGLWTGYFYDSTTDKTFVTDPDPADGVDEVFVGNDGSFTLNAKFDQDGSPVRLTGKIGPNGIVGKLTIAGKTDDFGCSLYSR